MTQPTDLTEAVTRAKLIDPALQKAGWDTNNPKWVGKEIPVDGSDPVVWQRLQAKLQTIQESGVAYTVTLPSGISDYVLYRADGKIVAIVEAKRTSVDPRLALLQAQFYVEEIGKRQGFQPFAFMSNGRTIEFWDGQTVHREVPGFFTLADLENRLYLRENQKPLAGLTINPAITDRPYQHQAIRQVSEAFAQGKRRTLLVMATGTGKTRTAMSLVDLFLRADQARRVLFVADRDALVEQALEEGFKTHLHEPATRIYTATVDTSQTNRLFVATLQTLSKCYQRFSPGFFDLIIFDEVHRSIFNKWNEVLNYFDARIVGLTATPAAFIDRNTFVEFHCYDNQPTFLYTHEEAVKEDYLVDFTLYKAQTGFQRKGIKGADLSEEERNALLDKGIDPDNLNYEGTDLEQKVSNADTLRVQWQEIWDKCYKDQSGQLPGKTIIFALSQKHALRLEKAFNEVFPKHGHLVRIITHKIRHPRKAIKDFKREPLPRIAISVDMLETGVNVPEVVNLVFMRPVHSQIRLNQMLGRGTRTNEACTHPDWLPGGHKSEFQIIDFWENDFRKEPDTGISQSLPVLVTIFNTRLNMLETLLTDQQTPAAQALIAKLRAQLAQIPQDTYAVKQLYERIEAVWQDSFWFYLTQTKIDLLRNLVAPLLRFVPDVDLSAATFISKVERLKYQRLTGQNPLSTAQTIAEDVSRLPDFVYQDGGSAQAKAFHFGLNPHNLLTADPADLDNLVEQLAGLMNKRKDRANPFLELDLKDQMDQRGYVIITSAARQPLYVEEYRERVDQRILELVANHPVIRAVEQGQPVTDAQLLELERTLYHHLGQSELQVSPGNIRKAYGVQVDSLLDFLRQEWQYVDLPNYEEIVKRQFDQFIQSYPFTADQINFLRSLRTTFLQKRKLQKADLLQAPFTSFGQNAVLRWFTPAEIEAMLEFVKSLTVE